MPLISQPSQSYDVSRTSQRSGTVGQLNRADSNLSGKWKTAGSTASGAFKTAGSTASLAVKEARGGKNFDAEKVRRVLSHTKWYRSPVADHLRFVLFHKYFAILMSVALFLALFSHNLWVIFGVNSNVEIDIILTLVMTMFAFEFVFLSAIDATYFLSFFFFMDIAGTVSMIADITYLLGASNTTPMSLEDASGTNKNLMLLRATRAARAGARVGRISRVVKLIRFLPFLFGDAEEKRGIAKHISNKLSNLLTTRVAGLVIILVIVIPMFDAFTFPQTDYSLETWVERLTKNLNLGDTNAFRADLDEMVDFFGRHDFGPFRACEGVRRGSDGFTCTNEITDWHPKESEPSRGASILMVHTSIFMVAFNMHSNIRLEELMAIVNICFTIFIMLFSGIMLNSVVNELAVQPLQRMLKTVQKIAMTVFKFSAEMMADAEEEANKDLGNIEQVSELKLLEKVVGKLAIVADLQTRGHEHCTDDMRDEDIAIIKMLQGKSGVEELAKHPENDHPFTLDRRRVPSLIKFDEIGIAPDAYLSWSFQVMDMTKDGMSKLVAYVITQFSEATDRFMRSPEDEKHLVRFVDACKDKYVDNAFHNFSHAADVSLSVSRMLRTINASAFLCDLEMHVLLISAVAHDLAHPGVNNAFLTEVSHELALRYNDRSPLENMHCAQLFGLVGKKEFNVFHRHSREQYREARTLCIEVILHTDMMGHMPMVKDLQTTFEMNSAIFTPDLTSLESNVCNSAAEIETLSKPDIKMLALNNILHSADVSNPCREFQVTERWAGCVLEEFFQQGDQEKKLGVPVGFLNDRDKLNRPNSQIGFLEFMIAPFFAAQIRLWPTLSSYGDNLSSNIGKWQERWVAEVNPGEEEKAKVSARVQKVQDNLFNAKWRGCPPPPPAATPVKTRGPSIAGGQKPASVRRTIS